MANLDAPCRRLIVDASHLTVMRRHAQAQRPEECCGILIGHSQPGRSEVERVVPTTNVAADRHRRYDIDPRQLLDAHRQVRREGGDIVGYFHSHPASAPCPSDTDLQQAWPGVSYVIVGVRDGRLTAVRSWRLDGSGGRFEEEELVVR